MFRSCGYIKVIILGLSIAFLSIFSISNSYSQCSALTNNVSIDFQVDGQCAPVEVTSFSVTYNFSISQNPNDVEIIIEWNDPTNAIDIFSVANGNLTVLTNNVPNDRYRAVGSFPYPQNNDCRFEPVASIRVAGTACAGSAQPQTVNSWSEDNNFGGVLAINPNEFNVCEGNGFTNIRFADASEFNCNIAVEPDDPNRQPRHVQFIYGTGHNPAEGIKNLTLDDGGVVTLTDAGGALNGTTTVNGITGTYFGPIEEVPFPADNPISETFPFSLADNPANVEDDYFEVTMVNWNTCNPYNGDPVNPNYGDAIFETARIVMVANPTTAIEFRNQDNTITSNFCPGDEIRLRQDGGTTGGTGNFEYRWEVFDGNNDGETVIYSSGGFNTNVNRNINPATTNGFSGGTKLVRLYIEDQDAEGNCVNTIDEFLTITAAPTAIIDYDYEGYTGTNPQEQICLEDFTSNQLLLNSVNTVDNSGNGYSVEWELFRRRNNIADLPANPDSTFTSTNSSITLNLTKAGVYRARLNTEDDITGCSTFDDFTFIIYDQPLAEFTANDVCEGEDVNFDPSDSEIPIEVEGDARVLYEWDFSYVVADGFQVENTETNDTDFDYNLGTPGIYNVALRVTTDEGCVSDIFEQTVEVKHNPQSDLEASYANDYEGNSAGDLYTGDPICPGTLLDFTNITNEALNDPSVDPVDYELQIDSLGTIVYREIGAPGEANESVSPNIFFNNTGSNEVYTVELVANGDNGCSVISAPINVIVLPGSASGFDVYDEPTFTDLYDPLIDYCSPYEFYFQIDNPTDNLLNPGDSLIWEVYDGSTLLGGDTTEFGDPDYDKFSFEFNNDFPSIAAINYTIVLQPYVDGVCVNNSQRTVRVLPRPTSEFTPADTVVTCDSVTYYFEAVQPGLLTYDWQVQTVADTLSTQNDGVNFWVSYARPDIGDPNVNVEVRLQTTNPFNCVGDLSDPFNDTILPKDDIEVLLDMVGTEFCAPTTFGFVNQTTDPVPAGTEWELIIKNIDLNDSTIIAGSSLSSNTEFRESGANIFEYEFTDSANYEIRLNALLPSTCDVVSDPPISLSVNEKPEVGFNIITNNSNNCAPLSVTIINETSNVPSGNDFNLSYEVRRPNGTLVGPGYTGTTVKGSSDPTGYNNFVLPPLSVPAGSPFIDYDISLIAETFQGCTADSTIKVRVYQEPDIDFDVISPNPACEENYNFEFEVVTNNIQNSDYELTWSWGDGGNLVTEEDSIVNHTFSNRASFFGTDTYTVTLSIETEYGCTATVNKTITLNPRVQAGFFKDKEQGCSPLPVNFTSTSIQAGISGNHQYEKRVAGTSVWIPFDSSPATTGAITETFENTSDSTQIYEIRYNVFSDISNGTICYDTAAIDSLTVFPEFSSPAITGPDEICAFAQQIPFTVETTAGSNYQWTLPSGAFISASTPNGDSINVNFSNFSGNVQVVEIDSNGCFGSPTIFPVNILTGPSGTLSLNGSNVTCPGDSTSLIFNLTGPGSQNFDVVYNNGVENDTLLNIASGHIEYVSPTVSTNYFLLSVKDREYPSCNPSAINGSAFVSVNVKPTATLSGSTTICEGNSTNLFFNLTGIGPWEVIYTDGNSNFTINTSNPFTLAPVSPTDSTTYSLVSITDGNTPVCSGNVSGSATVKVNSKPTAEIFGSQTNLCVNTPAEIGINLTGTPPWNVRYTDGDNIFTAANITPSGSFDVDNDTYTHTITISAAPGTKDYTLVDILDSNTPNCYGDVSGIATITAFDRPEASIEGTNTICLGESSPLTFNFVGDGPFDVLLTANQDTVEYNNLQNGQTINVDPEVSTVYRIIELTDTRGCFGNSLGGPISINVNNLPTSSLSGDDVTCYGEETELTFDQEGVGPWTITYTDGSQNFTFTTSFNRHFEPVFPTSTTTYSLVSVVDSNSPDNCAGTVSGTAVKEVFPQLVANFEASPETMVLPDRTVEIINNTTNKNEWEYEWDFGDGTISNEVDPADHIYDTYGEYIIRMTATNGQCTDTYQTVVTIGAIPPIVDFDATPKEGCLPLVVTFENLTQFADPSTYQWEFGDGQRVSAVENPTHVYRNPGTYTVRLTASNITGQRTEMLKEEFITVFATPQASFTIPDEYRQVFTGEEVRFVNLSEGADEYIWKFGDGNESFEFEPIHAYPDSGVYDITLIAINSETGCTDSVSLSSQVKVILGGESDVPNAFTPSRAGPGTASTNPLQNDFFLPRVEGVSQFNMKIYNRWGELLFESNDKNTGWDGYYNGVLMPQGVYVYRLELVYENGRRETKVGDITLIR